MDCRDAELSIVLVDDRQIEKLNRVYLHREGPTNVIAFSMREGPFANLTPQLLGDVVISVETAFKEGKETQISMQKRLNQLMVHGILHLLGYEHKNTETEAKRMQKKSRQLLQAIEN